MFWDSTFCDREIQASKNNDKKQKHIFFCIIMQILFLCIVIKRISLQHEIKSIIKYYFMRTAPGARVGAFKYIN